MQKLLPGCMLVFFFVTACKDRLNPEAIDGIANTLSKANDVIINDNKTIYDALADRLKDPITKAKTIVWYPKAVVVKSLSDDIYKYVGGLKEKLIGMKQEDLSGVRELFVKERDSVFNKLARYNNTVVGMLNPEEFKDNPVIMVQLRKDVESFTKDIANRSGILLDSLNGQPVNIQAWQNAYLNPSSLPLGMAIINKIQNDVLVTENMIIGYIFSNTTPGCVLTFEVFRAIATLSSSYVKAGQPIEVTAGVGAFTVANKPVITINGSMVKPDDNGTAIYKLTTNQKPGKYQVPVRIEYTKPDGSTDVIIKHLEYIVAE